MKGGVPETEVAGNCRQVDQEAEEEEEESLQEEEEENLEDEEILLLVLRFRGGMFISI